MPQYTICYPTIPIEFELTADNDEHAMKLAKKWTIKFFKKHKLEEWEAVLVCGDTFIGIIRSDLSTRSTTIAELQKWNPPVGPC